MIWVKPVDPAAVIRDPHTKRRLPPEGDYVPDNSYWRRRIAAGEAVLGTAPDHPEPVGNEPIPPLTTR